MPEAADLVPDSSVVLFPIDKVYIGDDEARQRKNAEPDDALLDSIAQRGLINPILIHADGKLVAGERRWRAHQKLAETRPKFKQIRATIWESLSPMVAYHLELLENLARKQLTWQEEVAAVARWHAMRMTTTSNAWTMQGTANDVGLAVSTISRYLLVAAELEDTEVAKCPTYTGAFNLIQGRAERARMAAQSRGLDFGAAAASALQLPPPIPLNATREEKTAAILDTFDLQELATEATDDIDKALAAIAEGKLAKAALEQQQALEIAGDVIINADFLEWADGYEGPKFDVIHCDFPYGKGYRGSNTRRTGRAHINPAYLDDPDIYFELVDGFLSHQDKFAFPAAHCLFWFDMQYYAWTIERFETAGWKLVQPFPLIWTKGYTGVASDPKRRPRHCYETALLFSRGDRKIVKLERDHQDAALEDKLHMSQKPQAILRFFLSMIVDEHTAVLDPTCGSGSSLVAARHLKAQRMLGIELDETNAQVARAFFVRNKPNEETSDE